MSIFEKFQSRDVKVTKKTGSIDRQWVITGSDDEATVLNTLLATREIVYLGLIAQDHEIKQIGPGIWEGSVNYGGEDEEDSQEKTKVGEFTFSFDTGGGKQKITSSPPDKFQAYNRPGKVPPSFQGGINATDKDVEGVEIIVPTLKFSLAYRTGRGKLNADYVKLVGDMTGKINQNQFLSFDARTVLFMGGTGSFKQGENIEKEVTLNFEYSPNKQNIKIGDIVVAEKGGWDYLWVHYRNEDDLGAACLVHQPYCAYVHKLYDEADFGALLS